MKNGEERSIMDVKVGDVVKAIDSNGQLIDSEIVSNLHKDSNKEGIFLL